MAASPSPAHPLASKQIHPPLLSPVISQTSDLNRHRTHQEQMTQQMASTRKTQLRLVLLCLSAFLVVGSDPKEQCVYSVYVKTGSIIKAGTDSRISVAFGDSTGSQIAVADLEAQWGLMEPGHDYYERGNLDIFSGRGPCLKPPLCRLNLTSDGTGPHHGWYCDYVEVTTTGPHAGCSQTLFYVQQWLATDAAPYELSAVVDGCSQVQPGELAMKKGRLVIGGNTAAAAV